MTVTLYVAQLSDFTLGQLFTSPEDRLTTSGVFIDLVGPLLLQAAVLPVASAFSQMSQRLSAAGTVTPQPGYDNTVFPAVEVVPGSRKFLGPALYTYSAHDTTIAAVMSGLGVFNSVGA